MPSPALDGVKLRDYVRNLAAPDELERVEIDVVVRIVPGDWMTTNRICDGVGKWV